MLGLFLSDVGNDANPNALYSVGIGVNDAFLWGRTAGQAELSADNTISVLEALRGAGAQHFFVTTNGLIGDPNLDAFNTAYDAALVLQLNDLIAAGLDITIFDTAAYQATFTAEKFAALGVNNPFVDLRSCLDVPECATAAAEAALAGTPFEHPYFTFDGTHLNTKLHEDSARFAFALIPEPGTELLLGLGLLGLARTAKRPARR